MHSNLSGVIGIKKAALYSLRGHAKVYFRQLFKCFSFVMLPCVRVPIHIKNSFYYFFNNCQCFTY